MKCPTCVAEGELSEVEDRGGARTLMGFFPFFDDQGRRHSHDPNTTSHDYRCSRGHSWKEEEQTPCPVCGPSDKWIRRPKTEGPFYVVEETGVTIVNARAVRKIPLTE